MKSTYSNQKNLNYFSKGLFVMLSALLISTTMNAQKIRLPLENAEQKISVTYGKDIFYLEPETLLNELVWYNKFENSTAYDDQIKYLRLASGKIELTGDQKEFRNLSEDKLHKVVVKILPKLIYEGKVSHFDKSLNKKSTNLDAAICEIKNPAFVKITNSKGRIIFDCEGKYNP